MNWAFAKCNWMFALYTLQQFITFFDYRVCVHTWIALLSLSASMYHLEPGISICSFANLQISLLENLALLLCILCEFGIGIVRMLIVWCQHCAQFTIFFECSLFGVNIVHNSLFSLNAQCTNTHGFWQMCFVWMHLKVQTLCIMCKFGINIACMLSTQCFTIHTTRCCLWVHSTW